MVHTMVAIIKLQHSYSSASWLLLSHSWLQASDDEPDDDMQGEASGHLSNKRKHSESSGEDEESEVRRASPSFTARMLTAPACLFERMSRLIAACK